jgi:hypothetical protein
VNDVILNPNYLAYKLNFENETVEFLHVEIDELQQLSFLRRDAFDIKRESIDVPLAQLVDLVNSPNHEISDNPPRFIFHTAFCASTFLSRCLDVRGVSICLREPQILLDAANAKRLQWESRSCNLNYTHLPKLALALLQKHVNIGGGTAKKLLIKPINSINNIIPELLNVSPASKSLMMYTDARNFLLSTMSKGEAAKQTVRAMFDLIRCDFPHLTNLSLSNAIHMSDLKLILTFWRLQIDQAESVMKTFGAAHRISSVYAESVIDDLSDTLIGANEILELGLSDEQLQSIVVDDRRYQDAKNVAQRFSPAERAERYQAIENISGADFQNAYQWMLQSNPSVSLQPQLSSPLLT